MSYNKAMKHWKNHRKDRYYQQCSGYAGSGNAAPMTAEERETVLCASFEKIVNSVKEADFPIYLKQCGNFCIMEETSSLYTVTINSFAELFQYKKDYLF